MKKVLIFVLIVIAFLMSACGTTINLKPIEKSIPDKEFPKMFFTSIAIEVKTEVEDCREEIQMFKKFLTNEFKERKITVVESETDTKMMVVIKHLKRVSKTGRFFWGSLAGSAELKAEIIITKDISTLSFFIDTSSQGASGVGDFLTGYGGSTDDLLNRTAKKIVEYIF